MRIVITGLKCSGKSTIARRLSEVLKLPCAETDDVVEQKCREDTGENLTCREIWEKYGEETFRKYETEAVAHVSELHEHVIGLGGSTFLKPEHRRMLYGDAILVWLNAPADTLWQRITDSGIPPFLRGEGGKEKFFRRCEIASEILTPMAHITCDNTNRDPDEVTQQLAERIADEMHLWMKSPNSLGEIIRVTTFGESHGPALGVVLEGLKPGVAVDKEAIQQEMARRRPGQSSVTTSRSEADNVRILSGVFEGRTTGTPLAMIVENTDADPSKYDHLKNIFRPGHADFTFWKKYGIRDHRGGGRSSGRETVSRVAAGAIARSALNEKGVTIRAWTEEIAGIRADEAALDFSQIESNPVRCPDPAAAGRMEEAVRQVRECNDSVGGRIRLQVLGLPAGIGDPVFGKLDARLSGALMSLGAVKGVEVGAGFAASRMYGSENNDVISADGVETNNAGGVLGGISTGAPVEMRLGVKPTPSIAQQQRTVTTNGEERDIEIEGRHDPCIVPRLVPVVEAMAALVLLDMWELQERLRG